MLVVPLFELLFLACTTGWSRALRAHGRSLARHARALSDNQLEVFGSTTTIPNHLPEEKFSVFTSATSPSPSLTTPKEHLVTTTTVSSLPKTMAPTVYNSTAAKLNTSLTATVTSPVYSHNITTTGFINTNTTNTTTTTNTTPDFTTRTVPQCNCSTHGSVDPHDCDPLTGGCKCLRGYSGLRCEQCYSGYFRNHTGDCQPCDCDSSGAAGTQCDSSGVCQCKVGVYGDKCDDCHPGFFNFSSTGCQACQCNNHSNTCDKKSGLCLNCLGNTRGPSCAECKPTFYRERGSSPLKSCLPCPCSSVTSSGNCTLDEVGRPVCDQCNPEYEGSNCEQCRDGYYNSDSICVPCDCNGNAEPSSAPRICDPDNGHCLSCSYNTTGTHCQHCAPGFTGDAIARNCTAIVPTTPVTTSTMTPTPNVTDQLPTSSTALLSSLTSPTTNSTSSPEAVNWAQFKLIVLAVIITLIVALLGAAGGFHTYRRYQNRKINAPFWTIELKEDNISFSSYHDSLNNADASQLLDDEACEAASNGQLTLNSPGSLYLP